MKHVLVLGNHLFPKSSSIVQAGDHVFMAEDSGLCTHFRCHKQKLVFFLAAMRHYRDYLLESPGTSVTYWELSDENQDLSYEDKLAQFIANNAVKELFIHEIEDKFFEKRICDFCTAQGVSLKVKPSPMFLVTREYFARYLKSTKKPFMKTFYEGLRRERGILMDKDGNPAGGKFSFDAENREKLPREIDLPHVSSCGRTERVEEVSSLVDELFADHPGETDGFWLPVTHDAAKRWLQKFLEERFECFGTYEDAISKRSPFLFHSALSPMLNIGLLTPEEVISKALEFSDIPINSREGFIRQVLGWREFVRGIYQNYSEEQEEKNFWGHSRKLKSCWYDGSTGMPPLDDAIKKAVCYGYNHHIERLMIISNVMLLTEVDPKEAHKWFMEMYVDSSDWVMGPNVYGMGQFSDGGIFATKPYTCGSNYIRKMSVEYPKGEWCDALDGLYWRFIDKHQDFYRSNPRMATMVGTLERMKSERKEKIYKAARSFQSKVTSSGA